MKRVLLGTVAACALASTSFAADLPSRTAAPIAPAYMVPVFTWTGFYIGANAGLGFAANFNPVFVAGGLFPTSNSNLVPGSSSQSTDFTGGGQVGYNWQTGAFVFGLEADLNYLGGSGIKNGTYPTNPVGYGAAYPTYTLSGFSQDNWFGTVRGRLGYAVDRALFYVTGGLAYGGTNKNGGVVVNGVAPFPNVAFTPSSSNNGSAVGWALGGGIEYAFTNNWSAKLEYLRIDRGFQTTVYSGGGGGALKYTLTQPTADNIVRVGLNYKFGG